MNDLDKVILTDCDGVLLNWEYAFHVWMDTHGFKRQLGAQLQYDVGHQYGIERAVSKNCVRTFNESAAIGFLPPLRDAIKYVRKLHEEHGYVFHCITSLSEDPHAYKLRMMNLEKLFGEGVFEKLICLDCGADKDETLAKYKDTGAYWIEDKPQNAKVGAKMGLESLMIKHGHNMSNEEFPNFPTWKDLYEHIVGI